MLMKVFSYSTNRKWPRPLHQTSTRPWPPLRLAMLLSAGRRPAEAVYERWATQETGWCAARPPASRLAATCRERLICAAHAMHAPCAPLTCMRVCCRRMQDFEQIHLRAR